MNMRPSLLEHLLARVRRKLNESYDPAVSKKIRDVFLSQREKDLALVSLRNGQLLGIQIDLGESGSNLNTLSDEEILEIINQAMSQDADLYRLSVYTKDKKIDTQQTFISNLVLIDDDTLSAQDKAATIRQFSRGMTDFIEPGDIMKLLRIFQMIPQDIEKARQAKSEADRQAIQARKELRDEPGELKRRGRIPMSDLERELRTLKRQVEKLLDNKYIKQTEKEDYGVELNKIPDTIQGVEQLTVLVTKLKDVIGSRKEEEAKIKRGLSVEEIEITLNEKDPTFIEPITQQQADELRRRNPAIISDEQYDNLQVGDVLVRHPDQVTSKLLEPSIDFKRSLRIFQGNALPLTFKIGEILEGGEGGKWIIPTSFIGGSKRAEQIRNRADAWWNLRQLQVYGYGLPGTAAASKARSAFEKELKDTSADQSKYFKIPYNTSPEDLLKQLKEVTDAYNNKEESGLQYAKFLYDLRGILIRQIENSSNVPGEFSLNIRSSEAANKGWKGIIKQRIVNIPTLDLETKYIKVIQNAYPILYDVLTKMTK